MGYDGRGCGGQPAMQGVGSILASVVAALLLAIGLVAMERLAAAGGASLGAAIAVAAIAAFLLAYDVLKRDELGLSASDGTKPEGGGGKAPIRPMFNPDEATVISAFARDGARKLSQTLPTTDKSRLVVLQVTVSAGMNYETDTLLDQLNIVKERTSPESWVYFVGPDRHFLYCAKVATILKHANDGRGFLDLVKAGQHEALGSYADLNSFALLSKMTSAQALGAMALKNAPLAMIIHEKYRTPIGPIDWATLATRVLRVK